MPRALNGRVMCRFIFCFCFFSQRYGYVGHVRVLVRSCGTNVSPIDLLNHEVLIGFLDNWSTVFEFLVYTTIVLYSMAIDISRHIRVVGRRLD
jgi:hypothetical protein